MLENDRKAKTESSVSKGEELLRSQIKSPGRGEDSSDVKFGIEKPDDNLFTGDQYA